jgi:hypothetical protein
MRTAGIPVTRTPYGSGAAGIRQSLEAMSLKMREGKTDARVIGWTGKVLRDAGLDGRDNRTTVRAQVTALLDAFRANVIYAPDAYGSEVIQSAAATLCLSPGLCLNRGDCDDSVVALGSATLSLGIPTQIVKQNYGPEHQEHVLMAVYDGNDWVKVDPSTNLPYGQAPRAQDELWVDPMDPIGTLPEATPEIVTLGKPEGLGRVPQGTPFWDGPTQAWYVSTPRGSLMWHPDRGIRGGGSWVNAPALGRAPPQVGAGAILGYATVADLQDLLSQAAYFMQQIQAAADACPAIATDPSWAEWRKDLQQAQADLDIATQVSASVSNSTPHWLWGVNVITYQWGLVRRVIDQEIDLDRRWRLAGSTCAAPEYANKPAFKELDVDQWTYAKANSAINGVEDAARNARQPLTIAAGGIVLGVGLTVGAFVILDRLFARR